MVSNNLQFKFKRNHAFFCIGVLNVYIFKFISNEITDLRKLDHLWKVTSWKYYPIRHIFSISTLINYVKQKKKSYFFVFLKISCSFYGHYCQLAGDTRLLLSADKIEKAAKRNLFENIRVDMILDITVLYNENYFLLCLNVRLNNCLNQKWLIFLLGLLRWCNFSVLFSKNLSMHI